MADVVATLTLTSSRVEGSGEGRVIKEYSITFDAGDDMPAGGIAMDFQGADNANWLPRPTFGRNPDGYEVLNHPTGYLAKIVPGTTLSTWKLELYGSGANAGDALSEAADNGISLDADTSCKIRLSGKNV